MFPVFFIGMWLVVTTLLGFMSGWYGLMQRYPDREEAAVTTLRWQSATMGFWVHMNGILTLGACPSGLRVAMLRVFGPFCRPFFVPWGEISATRSSIFFLPMVKLTFERSDMGALWLYPGIWDRLATGASRPPPAAQLPTPITNPDLAKGAVLQWALMTVLAAAFFYFAPRYMTPAGPVLPIELCIGLPAVVFGVAIAVRVLSQNLKR